LGENLPAEQAAGAQQIVAAMAKTTDPRKLSSLGSALGSLGENLSVPQVETASQQILAAMETRIGDHGALNLLEDALSSMCTNLQPKEAATVAQQIVTSTWLLVGSLSELRNARQWWRWQSEREPPWQPKTNVLAV
jgi:hypothetical protein